MGGMRTVWLTSDYEWANKGADEPYVHYISEDLKSFLAPLIGQTLANQV